jgi:hypothetical protein
MSKYLLVTHQTALSRNLQGTVRALVLEDPEAEFTVLVPETPGTPTTWEGETVNAAGLRAEAARTLLEETARARIVRTAVGSPDPLQAITDELLVEPGYDTLVICTLPPGISRWLKLDLVHRARHSRGGRSARPRPPMRRPGPTPPPPRLRAGDTVVLLGSPEHVEGEVIAVLAENRYRVRWTTGPGPREGITTVTPDEVRKKVGGERAG